MNWVVTADWHLGISEKHNQDIVNGCNEIRDYFDNLGLQRNIIIAGDIFNNPKPHPDMYKIFNQCLLIIDPHHIIVFEGNHDRNTATNAFSTYEPNILESMYNTNIDSNMFSCIEYKSVEDFGMYVQEAYDELETKGKILVTHTDIPGAAMGSEREIQLGSVGSLPVMKGVKFIISGHIHKHQSGIYGGVPYLYPGSLARVSHTEEDQPKGFVLFDDETLEWEFIERKTDRKWLTVDIDWKGQFPKSALNNKADVVRVRIKADAKYRGAINVADLKKQLPYDQSKLLVAYESVDKVDDSVIESGSISEYEKEWIDKNIKEHKADVKKRLRTVLSDIESKDIMKSVFGMTLQSIKSENFQSLRSVNVQFNPDDCVGILGMVSGEVSKSNGVGKSSFVELVRWNLFGVTRYSKATDAIQDDQDSLFSEISFTDKNRKLIIIRRELTASNKSTATVSTDDELLAKGPAEVNKWVITNLGLTQKAFDTIVYVGNTNVKDFISATASERLALMQEPIDLDKYKKAEKLFKNDLKTVSTRLTELKGAISVHEDFLKDTDIKELKSEEKDLKSNLAILKDELSVSEKEQTKLKNAVELIDKQLELQNDITGCETDIKDTEKEIAELEKKKKSITPLKKQLKETIDKITSATKQKVDGDNKLAELRHTLSMYQLLKDDPNCPVCESKITDKIKETQHSKIEHITKVGKSLKTEVDKVSSELSKYETEKTKLDRELVRLERLDDDVNRSKKELNEFKGELKDLKAELGSVTKKLEGIPGKKSDIRKKSESLADHIQSVTGEIVELQNDLTVKGSEILQYNEYTAKLKLHQVEYKEKQKESTILSMCVQAVTTKGIPKFVVMQLIDQLNDVISQITVDFNFWQIIDIYLEPDLQKDSVSIFCSFENKPYREYEGLSAGQRMVVNLILRQAYKQVLETLRDVDYSFVILDEALDKLDATNLNAVISYFKRKKMQSLCISHNDLKDTFTRTLFVKSENGVSLV